MQIYCHIYCHNYLFLLPYLKRLPILVEGPVCLNARHMNMFNYFRVYLNSLFGSMRNHILKTIELLNYI